MTGEEGIFRISEYGDGAARDVRTVRDADDAAIARRSTRGRDSAGHWCAPPIPTGAVPVGADWCRAGGLSRGMAVAAVPLSGGSGGGRGCVFDAAAIGWLISRSSPEIAAVRAGAGM